MKFIGQTNKQWHEENTKLVNKWIREDAHKIDLISSQWKYEKKWHSWFAWFPVKIDDGVSAWFEFVERKLESNDKPRIMASWYVRTYQYRAIKNK